MNRQGTVVTGRQKARLTEKLCIGCGMRRSIGDPKPNAIWPQRLSLTPEQVDLILVAAAEFEELSEQAGTISNAVDFADWMSVDALRTSIGSPIVADFGRQRKGAA